MTLIAYVTRIHFADHVLEDALGEELIRFRVRRPLLVCDDAGRRGDAHDRIEDALPAGVRMVSVDAEALSLRDLAAAVGSGHDGIVALGGPRALDLARGLRGTGGGSAVPLIAIPTTTATVGIGPAATLGATGRRNLPDPSVVLCDPTLTLSADAAQTAAAGMDALTHCIEAFLGTAYNPPADGIAIEGARRAWTHLERAVTDGTDLEARREMLAAAMNAGLAAQKGQGGAEAVAHALEAEAGLTARHGYLHAAVLPHVLSFNAPAVAERLEALGHALRLRRAADLPEALAALGARIGLPDRLSPLGFGPRALRRIARRAAADPASLTNPRHATEADYLGLLEAAM